MKRRRLLLVLPASATVVLLGAAISLAQPDGAPPPPAAPAAAQPSPDVKIVFTVLPSTKNATVMWGKKRLGVIEKGKPLVVKRPRDSGPLDVVVKSDGCLPVQTRAYTFGDSKVAVKLTPLDQKNTLLGYREELPPEGSAPPEPDGGATWPSR